MSSARVRLVCFDWGGVILRICRAWPEACAAAGLPARPGVEGGESSHGRAAIVRSHQEGRISFEQYTRELSRSLGGVYTPDEVAMVHDAWLLHEYDGVAALIDELHAAGSAETALLSNTNERHLLRGLGPEEGGLGHFPTAHRLRHRIYSNRVGLSKPGPEIYHAVCRQAGVGPGDVLFFDDLEENIETARALGWRAERIDPGADTAAQMRRVLREHGVL